MRKIVLVAVAAAAGYLFAHSPSPAQQEPGFARKEYNFDAWTKGRFAQMVTVTRPGKYIAIAGTGAESEENGKTLYPGDMLGQCRYAFMKIKKALATQGATLADATRMVTFVTDMGQGVRESGKPYQDWITCRKEAFAGGPQPASTIVQIGRLASPDMMIEINIDAWVER